MTDLKKRVDRALRDPEVAIVAIAEGPDADVRMLASRPALPDHSGAKMVVLDLEPPKLPKGRTLAVDARRRTPVDTPSTPSEPPVAVPDGPPEPKSTPMTPTAPTRESAPTEPPKKRRWRRDRPPRVP